MGAGGSSLSNSLQDRFILWVDARKPQEEEFLDAYQDMMRIPRDGDTKETGIGKSQKSRVFVGSTRGKIRAARAKIKDVLFGSGKLPFDTSPNGEKLKKYADVLEEVIAWQLKEMKFPKLIGTGVDAICTYGTGFLFGPFVKDKTHEVIEEAVDPLTGQPVLQERTFSYPCPYYEHGRTMDVYPDPDAEDVSDGLGVFWAARKQPEFIRELRGKPGYWDRAIDFALTQKVTQFTDEGSDRSDLARANIYRMTKDGRIWFVRFFGKVKRAELKAWQKMAAESQGEAPAPLQADPPDGEEPVTDSVPEDLEERVEATVIMAGGVVIRAEENARKQGKRPSHRCVYEDVEHEMWGVGIAKNNYPHQRVVNAAFRLYLEGKAMALLKMFSADRSKFEANEDFKLFPGKRFAMRAGLTPDERKTALIWHDVLDVTGGWERVIEMSSTFSDDDTGITKYTQGTDSSSLNKTAHGISMIMNASSLPLKEVISNIDQMWIEKVIEDLIEWNMEFLEPEVVELIFGKEKAAAWHAIKSFGKTNFLTWKATGSQTFMMKEVLMQKLQGYLQMVLAGGEVTIPLVDMRELLDQVWEAGEINRESPVYDEETLKQKQQMVPAQVVEKMQKEMQAVVAKMQEELRAAKSGEAIKLREISARERVDTISEIANIMKAGAQVAEAGSKVDLNQATTVKTLVEAGVTPAPGMTAAAGALDGTNRASDAVAELAPGGGGTAAGGAATPPGGEGGDLGLGGLPGSEGGDLGTGLSAGAAEPAPAGGSGA